MRTQFRYRDQKWSIDQDYAVALAKDTCPWSSLW
jgi:hypothetical protein